MNRRVVVLASLLSAAVASAVLSAASASAAVSGGPLIHTVRTSYSPFTSLGFTGTTISGATSGGISGTVAGASDAAVAGVCVGAFRGGSAMPAALAVTGSGGGYRLSNLVPGRYAIQYSSCCGAASYPARWYSGAASRATAIPVAVTAGSAVSGIDARRPAGPAVCNPWLSGSVGGRWIGGRR